MERNFKQALIHRRSCYSIEGKSPISDGEIQEILEFALNNLPSAFNSQSTRMVLLFGPHHKKLWNILKDRLKAMLNEKKYAQSAEKIDSAFSCGYATILFFEDNNVVKNFQNSFPTYADKFPQWSEHTSGMHQLAVWTMLEDAGLGASLQHYNGIIDADVKQEWNIPESWRLISQMPFGLPIGQPAPKEMHPTSDRLKVFKD